MSVLATGTPTVSANVDKTFGRSRRANAPTSQYQRALSLGQRIQHRLHAVRRSRWPSDPHARNRH